VQGIWQYVVPFISLIIAYSFYWVGAWLYGPRYYFEAVPGMALLSAGGFGWLGGWLGKSDSKGRWRKAISLVFLLILMATNVLFYLPLRVGGMKGLYQIERETAARFIVDKPEKTLVMIKTPHWYQYARYLYQVEPFRDSPLLIAWSRGSEIDEALASSYEDRNTYYFDPATGEIEAVY
jgi:hypothetical protein